MYQKEDIEALAERLKETAQKWVCGKIDELAVGRPKLKAVSVYLKRGLYNWLEREDKRICSMLDGLALFVADKEGHIDTDMLINDATTMFREMDVCHTDECGFGIDYGQGMVAVTIPHKAFLDFVFGDLGQVKITVDDLLEMRGMLKNGH